MSQTPPPDDPIAPISTLIDLASLSANFPPAPTPELQRDNVVNTLRTLLDDNVYAAAMEGPEGAGKTTVLAQFVRQNSNTAVSTFISATNRLSFDADLIRVDIAGQVYFAATGDILPRERYEPALLKSQYADLQRIAKRKRSLNYFVLDGLEELSETVRTDLLQQLADILPIGVPQFRFLFSGDASLYATLLGAKLPIKPFPLTEFSLEETKMLFSGQHLDPNDERELHGLCRGMPGRLTSILRASQSGLNIPAFLQDPPSHRPEFFDVEWSQVPDTDDTLRRILALLVHDAKPHTVTDVADLLGLSDHVVKEKIGRVSFLSIDPVSAQIHVANTGLSKFIGERLADRKPHIQKLLIKRLLATPDSNDSVLQLPEYLEEASQFQDLLTLLTPDHILQVLERSQTLSRVDDAVNRGFRSAERLGKDPDLLRFGIQRSVIGELAASDVWESEVSALSALGRDAEALALANNAVLKEDRLQLLASSAHGIWVRGDDVSPELLEQIRLLIENLDFRVLGSRAQHIASQLTCISPDLATFLLRKTKLGSADDNDLDRAFAHLTIAALNDLKDERRRAEALDTIAVSRKDPKAKSLLQGMRLLSGRLSSADVCARVDEIERPDAKIALLRYWCVLNSKQADADLVAQHGLTIALRTTFATLDASLIADFSMALGGAPNPERKKSLIAAIDGVRGTTERLGPSVDYVRLQLSMAAAEYTIDHTASEGRLIELIDYVARIAEVTSRGESYARFLGTLCTMDAMETFASGDSLHKQCANELDTVVLQLSLSTADHYLALGDIVTALAVGYLDKALEIVGIVNTELRRDAILVDVVEALLERPVEEILPAHLTRVLGEIRRSTERDRATQMVMERFADARGIPEPVLEGLMPLISSLPELADSIRACGSMVSAIKILHQHSSRTRDTLREHIKREIHARWAQIDIGWIRIDTGFAIASDLALAAPDDAGQMLLETETLKNELHIAADKPAAAYVGCIYLAIRALCGLLPRKLETETDLRALAALIDTLPSYGERAVLWADLCMRCSLAGRVDLTERLVKEFLEPTLNHVPESDRSYRARVLVQIAPALFRARPTTCLELLAGLEPDDRDSALRSIVRFLLYARVPSDPVETPSGGDQVVSWEVLRGVTDLIDRMDTDWIIYATAEDVADALQSSKNRYTISSAQREDIAHRVEAAAGAMLPTKRQIAHMGYRIVSLAQALRGRQAKTAEWTTLIAQARGLENIADRALVMQTVAFCLPSSLGSEKSKLLLEVRAAIADIPSEFDRFERYLGLAEELRATDVGQCRELLRVAAAGISKSSDDIRERQRRLVDLAYKVDESLARTLIDHFDDDEAKRSAQRQLRLLEARKHIGDDEGAGKALLEIQSVDLSKLGWSLFRALNSGRVQTFHPADIRPYLQAAAGQPLRQSFSILTWYIENAVIRFARTEQATSFLRPMLDATIVGAQLAGQVAGRSLIRLKALKHQSAQLSVTHSIMVTPGTRDEAVQVLSTWFERQLGKVVKICDPYFGPGDLSWLQIIRTARPGCSIQIMTARKNQPPTGPGEELEDIYTNSWRRLYDQTAPNAEIAIIGGERSKDTPIHDRWIVSESVGLRLGTSLNSLGLTKDSEISEMSPSDVAQKLCEIDQYLSREKTEHRGEKLRLTKFGL